ncbi:amidohydrolase family protein [Fonsecaea pedrosoi]|nr:amidohydrolase family protein [Fonsecaea pedrosoi]
MAATHTPSSILLRGGTILTHGDKDHVVPLWDTDLLVRNGVITDIGKNISPPSSDTEVIDCKGKIISPGFVDTHHHLWQTQLKGRHAEQGLVSYMYTGNMMSYAYSPDDMYWGQLSGCLEAIHAGTTTVLDHAHCAYSPAHEAQPSKIAASALNATIDSGIRGIFAYSIPMRISKWDQSQCTPDQDLLPEWALKQIAELAETHNQPGAVVEIGMGFDFWFLPQEMVLGMLAKLRQSGLRVLTSHAGCNAFMGLQSPVPKFQSYKLLGAPYPPPETAREMPFLLLSHCNGLPQEDLSILASTGTPISSTPGTEAQMGMSYPVALDPALRNQYGNTANVSLGVDCHSSEPSSMPQQARMLLQLARVEKNARLLAKGQFPSGDVTGTSEDVFNLATIRGARCLGLDADVGSIAPGKKADLLVFNASASVGMLSAAEYDPVVAIVRFSEAADIDTVIVDGVVRKRAGKLLVTPVGRHVTASQANIRGTAAGEAVSEAATVHLEWTQIADRVRRSQREIQSRIDGLSLDKARDMMLSAYHTDLSRLVDAR